VEDTSCGVGLGCYPNTLAEWGGAGVTLVMLLWFSRCETYNHGWYGFKNGRASTMWHSEMQQWLCNIIAKTVND